MDSNVNMDGTMFPNNEYLHVQQQSLREQNDVWMYDHIRSGTYPTNKRFPQIVTDNTRLPGSTARILASTPSCTPAATAVSNLKDHTVIDRFECQELECQFFFVPAFALVDGFDRLVLVEPLLSAV